MRHALLAALTAFALAACSDPNDRPCVRDVDCSRGAVCRGGVCLRHQLAPGTPYDPRDASLDRPRPADASPQGGTDSVGTGSP